MHLKFKKEPTKTRYIITSKYKFLYLKIKSANLKIIHNIHKLWRDGGGGDTGGGGVTVPTFHSIQQINHYQTPTNSKISFLRNKEGEMEELTAGLQRAANSVTDHGQSSRFFLYLILPLLCFPFPRALSLFFSSRSLGFYRRSRNFFGKYASIFDENSDNLFFIQNFDGIPSKFPMEKRPDRNSVRNVKIRRNPLEIPSEIAAGPTVHFPDAFCVGDGWHFCKSY